MAEELGKIERLSVDSFQGKKLYFVPLIYKPGEMEAEYAALYEKYWDQVESQIINLEAKLGNVKRIFHELIAASGETGLNIIQELNPIIAGLIKRKMENCSAELEITEDADTLTEFMDWGRCLSINLQNPGVFNKVYDSYAEAGKKRNENIAKLIGEKLKEDEAAILFMREGHSVQFPKDIQVIYVSPPALDEIKRWLRDRQQRNTTQDDTAAEIVNDPEPEPGKSTPEQSVE